MATDETVVIECDECGATFSPPEPTKSIKKAREEAAENNWSHVIDPFEVDWCPDCSINKINSRTCGNYAKCKKVGLCHASCWKPKGETTENKTFRLEKVVADKREAISRLMKEKEVAEDRIAELKLISLAKDKELDRFNKMERELKTAMEQKEYWKNQYATLSLNKGNPGMKGFPKQRVEVDKNGVVEYCEFANQCPSANESLDPDNHFQVALAELKKRSEAKRLNECPECHTPQPGKHDVNCDVGKAEHEKKSKKPKKKGK